MQHTPIDEIVFCHTHKQFHLSHVTVADPDSSDSSRRVNLIQYPQKFCSARLKKFSLQKNLIFLVIYTHKLKVLREGGFRNSENWNSRGGGI